MPLEYQDELLTNLLIATFGELSAATLALVRQRTEWVEVRRREQLKPKAGQTRIRDILIAP